MATIDDIRKLPQDFLAPDLAVLKEGQQQLRTGLKDLSNEVMATELRLMEAMKTESLLTVKVGSQQERIAELTRENEKLKSERAQ